MSGDVGYFSEILAEGGVEGGEVVICERSELTFFRHLPMFLVLPQLFERTKSRTPPRLTTSLAVIS